MNCLNIKRKEEQKVFIYVGGEKIEIIITKIWMKSVALAFKADRDKVKIVRDNAHDKDGDS